MGFLRVSASADGKLKQPLRAGAGFIANVIPTRFSDETDATLTIAQISGGSIIQGSTLTSEVIYTTPTAVEIIAEWPEMDIGDSYTFYAGSHQGAAFDMVIISGVGIDVPGPGAEIRIGPKAGMMITLTKLSATTMQML